MHSSRGSYLLSLAGGTLPKKDEDQKDKLEQFTPNQIKTMKSEKNAKKCYEKSYETTADLLGLYDNGKWEEFQERMHNSFKEIKTHNESKDKFSSPECELLPPDTSILELSVEELNGTPVERLLELIESREVINKESENTGKNIRKSLFGQESSHEELSTDEDKRDYYYIEAINSNGDNMEDSNIKEGLMLLPADEEFITMSTDNNNTGSIQPDTNFLAEAVCNEEYFSDDLNMEDGLRLVSGVEEISLNSEKHNTDPMQNNTNFSAKAVCDEGSLSDDSDIKGRLTSLPANEEFITLTTDKHNTDPMQNDTNFLAEAVCNEEPLSDVTNKEESGALLNSNGRKKNSCYYCSELVTCTNYSRHLSRRHKNEIDVIRFLQLPKKSDERKDILTQLRNKGNYLFNAVDQRSSFVPARRPLKDLSPKKKHYVSCSHCLVLVKRKNFFLHLKTCKKNEKNLIECRYCNVKIAEGHLKNHVAVHCDKVSDLENDPSNVNLLHRKQKRVLQTNSIYVGEELEGASEDLVKNILPLIRSDEIGEIVKKDPLILTVGSKLRSNHREFHLQTHITSKMRDLAKIVKKMKQANGRITNLKDCLKSENVMLLFKVVQDLCGYDELTGEVKIPSMPGRVKGSIGLALETLKNTVRSDENLSFDTKQELVFDIQTTQDTIKTDWRFVISTNAGKSLNEKHRNKALKMALEEDIKTASNYLSEQEKQLYDKLKRTNDSNLYEQMCETLIADLVIFNCRRAGEVARARLKDYLQRGDIQFEGDLCSVLTESEIAARNSLTMFYVPGKRDRSVPILLTDLMKQCVDLIVTLREDMNVGKNLLLFPRLLSDRPYDSCKIIRDLKKKIILKKPENFTSTLLRHEIATNSHREDYDKPGYRKVLFSHMGHTELVHNSKYVTPLPILQVAKVGAKLLNRRSLSDMQPVLEGNASLQNNDQATSSSCPNPDEKHDPSYEPVVSFSSEDELPIKRKRRKMVHTPWTYDQQKMVITGLKRFFKEKSVPGKQVSEALIKENACLQGRTWKQVNAFVCNVNAKRKKLSPNLAILLE